MYAKTYEAMHMDSKADLTNVESIRLKFEFDGHQI